MITQDVADALNVHMGREFGAHFQYLSLSGWFDQEGLPELAGFFAAQAAEEHMHAMKFWRYIQDAGATLAVPGVEAPQALYQRRRRGQRGGGVGARGDAPYRRPRGPGT